MSANLLTPTTLRWSTLSFAGKIEGKKGIFSEPSFPLAEERVDQRSVVGVSNYMRDISSNSLQLFRYYSPNFQPFKTCMAWWAVMSNCTGTTET